MRQLLFNELIWVPAGTGVSLNKLQPFFQVITFHWSKRKAVTHKEHSTGALEEKVSIM